MEEMNPESIRRKLRQIRSFVLDMDGTIYLGDELFPFTRRFLDKVEETGRSYCYFTNNSSRDAGEYLERLERMGIPACREKMMMSTDVILEYLARHYSGKRVYVVGTPALCRAFAQAGWALDEEDPDVVILGFDRTLTYEKLARLCTFVRQGKTYFGVNPDLNCPVENGEFIPDCGSIARCVEASTGVLPEFFGKPSRRALDYIVRHEGGDPRKIAVVGDRMYTDIAVCQDSEVTSILVLSGEATMEEAQRSPYRADIIVPDLGKLADLMEPMGI